MVLGCISKAKKGQKPAKIHPVPVSQKLDLIAILRQDSDFLDHITPRMAILPFGTCQVQNFVLFAWSNETWTTNFTGITLYIESDILEQLGYENIIETFTNKNRRRMPIVPMSSFRPGSGSGLASALGQNRVILLEKRHFISLLDCRGRGWVRVCHSISGVPIFGHPLMAVSFKNDKSTRMMNFENPRNFDLALPLLGLLYQQFTRTKCKRESIVLYQN